MALKLSIITILIVLVRWFAETEADNDAFRANHLRRIEHRVQFRRRLVMGMVLVSVFMLLWWWLVKWHTALVLVPLAWSSWTMLFRHEFNSERRPKQPFWYMGPELADRGKDDSWYDTQAHKVAALCGWGNIPPAPFSIAISFEAAVLVGSFVVLLL